MGNDSRVTGLMSQILARQPVQKDGPPRHVEKGAV